MPTYNEMSNIDMMIARVHAANPDCELLIVDDNSPDGTGKHVDSLLADNPWIHVVHREGKGGLGAAYRAGFSWALENNYGFIVEMDADGSHQPEQLPALLDAARDADLVIGSRWVPGGTVVNWPLSRKILSRGGNWYVRLALGMRVKDATGGYRVFKADCIRAMKIIEGSAQGYVFQVDNTYKVFRGGLTIVEVPIEFVERVNGASKMSRSIVLEAILEVTKWAIKYRILRQKPVQ